MTGRTMLSVDFDAFFPLPPTSDPRAIQLYDWGHNEGFAPGLADFLWMERGAGFLRHDGKLPEIAVPEGGWWHWWKQWTFADEVDVVVCDSHMHGWQPDWLPITRIVNVDAHHDLGYSGTVDEQIHDRQQITCADWLVPYVYTGTDVTIIYPEWRRSHEEGDPADFDVLRSELAGSVTLLHDTDKAVQKLRDEMVFDCIVVARSGTWTPPWCDDEFNDMVEDLTNVLGCTDYTEIDLYERLLTEADMREHAEQCNRLLAEAEARIP